MKTIRSFALCMFMALILVIVPAIFAQEETLGLSQEDFDLLTTANENTGAADSFAYDFSVAFSVSGEAGVSADLTGSGVLSGDEANPQFSLVVTGETVSEGETTPVNLELRLIGDTLYTNAGDGEGWKGQLVEDLTSEIGDMAGGMTGMDTEAIESGDLSGLAGMDGMGEAMSALSSLEPSEFLTLTRSDADGLAQYTLDVSISDLLSSPALAPLFGAALGSMGGGSQEMTAEQSQAMVGMMAGMFSTATVTLDEYINTDSSLVERAVIDVNIPIPDMTGTGETTTIALNFDIGLSAFNEPVSLEVPADVVME